MILREQYTIERFKTQYPKLNKQLEEKISNTKLTLDKIFEIVIKSDPTYDPTKDRVGRFQHFSLNLFSNNIDKDIGHLLTFPYGKKHYKDLMKNLHKIVQYREQKKMDNFMEDGMKEKQQLGKARQEMTNEIINLVTLKDLKNYIDNFKNDQEEYFENRQLQKIQQTLPIEVLLNDKEQYHICGNDLWDIYIPFTKKQQVVLGKNTKWCISQTKTKNHFDSSTYNQQPFIIVIPKNDLKDQNGNLIKFAIHFSRTPSYWEQSDIELDLTLMTNIPLVFDGLYDVFKKVNDLNIDDILTILKGTKFVVNNSKYIESLKTIKTNSFFDIINQEIIEDLYNDYVIPKQAMGPLTIEQYWERGFKLFITLHHINLGYGLKDEIMKDLSLGVHRQSKLGQILIKYLDFEKVKNNKYYELFYTTSLTDVDDLISYLNKDKVEINNKELFYPRIIEVHSIDILPKIKRKKILDEIIKMFIDISYFRSIPQSLRAFITMVYEQKIDITEQQLEQVIESFIKFMESYGYLKYIFIDNFELSESILNKIMDYDIVIGFYIIVDDYKNKNILNKIPELITNRFFNYIGNPISYLPNETIIQIEGIIETLLLVGYQLPTKQIINYLDHLSSNYSVKSHYVIDFIKCLYRNDFIFNNDIDRKIIADIVEKINLEDKQLGEHIYVYTTNKDRELLNYIRENKKELYYKFNPVQKEQKKSFKKLLQI